MFTAKEKEVLKRCLRTEFDSSIQNPKELISISEKLNLDTDFVNEMKSDYEFDLKEVYGEQN